MDTVHFHDMHEKGELGDGAEYVRWAGGMRNFAKTGKGLWESGGNRAVSMVVLDETEEGVDFSKNG